MAEFVLLRFKGRGFDVTPFAADKILDEILIAEQNGHSLQPEFKLGPDYWVGRCEKCGWASVIASAAQFGQYGGILNKWLRKPCGLNRLMRKVGIGPLTADLIELK
jgi:hypothetical protein